MRQFHTNRCDRFPLESKGGVRGKLPAAADEILGKALAANQKPIASTREKET